MALRILAPVVVAVLFAACATGTDRSRRIPSSGPGSVSPAVQEFVVSVDLLPSDLGAADKSQIAGALRMLAAALPDVDRGREFLARAERLRILAQRLQREPDVGPSEIAARALREAVGALHDLGGNEDVRVLHTSAAEKLARLDPTRPMLAQVGTIRAVLRDVANGLLAARGLEPSVAAAVDGPEQRSAAGAPAAPPPVEAARRASERVASLGRSSSSDVNAQVAAALNAFADALEHVRDRGDGALAQALTSLRGNADRLSLARDLAAARWAKPGLLAACEALAAVAAPMRSPILNDWIALARAAASELDDSGLLSFQRAPLQESLRLIADALMLAATRDGLPPEGSSRPAP